MTMRREALLCAVKRRLQDLAEGLEKSHLPSGFIQAEIGRVSHEHVALLAKFAHQKLRGRESITRNLALFEQLPRHAQAETLRRLGLLFKLYFARRKEFSWFLEKASNTTIGAAIKHVLVPLFLKPQSQ